MSYSYLGAQIWPVAIHTFIHMWNEPYLSLLSSHRASPHFGRYSFSVPLNVEG